MGDFKILLLPIFNDVADTNALIEVYFNKSLSYNKYNFN